MDPDVCCTAPALVRKWRTACEEWGPAAQALQKAGEEVDPKDVEQWKKLAKRAAEMRHKDIKVMDVFEFETHKRECTEPARWRTWSLFTELSTVPTRAEIQLQLTKAENELRDGLKGSAAWLGSGLKIEETRCAEFGVCVGRFADLTVDCPLLQKLDP